MLDNGLLMKRDEKIDITRGLAMILVVLGHAGFPLKSYIYLFHVAVFFIIAGVCWKEDYSDGLKTLKVFLKRKIWSLYIPYIIWLDLFSLLHNFFLNINFYSDNELFLEGNLGNSFGLVYSYSRYDLIACIIKNFLFMGNEPMAGASWFIRCLFLVVVLWTSIDFLIKKTFPSHIYILRWGISCFFMGIGNYLRIQEIYLPFNLSTVFSVYILFCFGIYYNKIVMEKLANECQPKKIHRILFFFLCIVLLGVMNMLGNVELSMNQYESICFLLIASILGWTILVEVASIIKISRIRKVLSIIGQNTVCILFLHFLVFKLINVLQVVVYGMPFYRIAGYPTLYSDRGWWIMYTTVGIIVPVGIKQVMKRLLNRYYVG